ncbi:helix-turn-helix domain-containing protein [Delftia sp. K82]|uniref:helix-turn-helix domain-containing protein n=1 Tax=Delftia sp. K82 TaxID=1472718 RepID=UPI000B49118B|nr:helix-turn-helix transcriptional regulator [Delftia sp. K82]
MPPRTKPPSSIFGKRLREARLRTGMPQDQLGVAVGLDETTASARMSRYETGVHEPPLDTSNRIAQVLGVPTAYLYCEDDDLADVILAWSKLARVGRAQAKKAVLGLVAGR